MWQKSRIHNEHHHIHVRMYHWNVWETESIERDNAQELESRWLILSTYGFVRNVYCVFQTIKPEYGVTERDATKILLQKDY